MSENKEIIAISKKDLYLAGDSLGYPVFVKADYGKERLIQNEAEMINAPDASPERPVTLTKKLK